MRGVADVLWEVRDFLADPKRWHKGGFRNGDGTAYCIVGALSMTSDWGVGRQAVLALASHLPGVGDDTTTLTAFNDRPSTTHEDVLTLIDKTLAGLGALA